MTVQAHRMAADMFTTIARGHGGVGAIEVLRRAQDSKTKALLAEVTDRAVGPDAAMVRQAYALLAKVNEGQPRAFEAVLRHPVVGAWAVEAARAHPPVTSPSLARMTYVAAAAAVRSGARHELVLPAPVTPEAAVPFPTLGHAVLPDLSDGPLVLRTGSAGAELVTEPAMIRIGGPRPHDEHWEPTARLTATSGDLRIELLLDRASWLLAPRMAATARHAIATARPDRSAWQRHLDSAWRVLVARHRPTAAEAAATFSVLTPLNSPGRGQNSGTYRDAFGCVSMSAPVDGVTGAAALAHELQHAKLAALMDMFTLLEPGETAEYYAPWRPDPRPAEGLLHGVYAHLGLAAFWAAEGHGADPARTAEAQTQFARWRRGAHEAAHTLLEHAALTPLGRRFVVVILDKLHQLGRTSVSAEARDRANREAQAHRRQWTRTNGVAPGRPPCALWPDHAN